MIRTTDFRARLFARSKLPYVLLIIIVGCACALRLYRIDEHSYWLDEFLALEKAAGNSQLHRHLPTDRLFTPQRPTETVASSPGHIWSSLATDNHPPLYFVSLRAWTSLFGSSELATRSMSVLFSAIAMILAFDCVRRFHGSGAATWVVLAMAVATPQIAYAQETRMYAMAMALVLAVAWVIIRIETAGHATIPHRVALTLFATAAVLTHYLCALPLIGMAVYCFVRLPNESRNRVLASVGAAAVLFGMLWGPVLVRQQLQSDSRLQFARVTDDGAITPALQRLGELPVRHLINPTRDDTQLPALSFAVLLIPIVLARTQKRLWLWLLPFLLTVGAIWIGDLVRGTWSLGLIRYSLPVAPALLILACASTAHLASGWLRHALPATICLSAILGIGDAYTRFKPDARSAAGWLEQRMRPGDVVVFAYHPDIDWMASTKYLEFSHYLSHMPDQVVILSRAPDAGILRALASQSGVWVVLPMGAEVHDYFPEAIEEVATQFPFSAGIVRIDIPDDVAFADSPYSSQEK